MSTDTPVLFDQLALDERVREGIRSTGFSQCTPIQAKSLPVALSGKDVAGQAQTGTGKTAAFLLATLQHLLSNPADERRRANQPRAVILAPTRELAIQIDKDAQQLGAATGLKIGVVYGGAGYDSQRKMVADGLDILIGTPGRVIDYFKQKIFDFQAVQVLVLDEADRMFDLGFIKDVRFMLRRMPAPEQRLNLLFSATMSYKVTELAYEHMNQPELVSVDEGQVTARNVRELCYYTANSEKLPLLIGLLKGMDPRRTMVFVNTKRAAERVDRYLRGNGFSAAMLSGDVPQRKRQRYLSQFQAGELAILVATDVAARGLHIDGVSHVFNYDLPQDCEDYVHRIGRTARAGADGDAISFACEDFAFSLPEIEAYIGHSIPAESVDPTLLVELQRPAAAEERLAPRSGGRNDKPRNGGGNRNSGNNSQGNGKPRRRKPRPKPEGSDQQPAATTTPQAAAPAAANTAQPPKTVDAEGKPRPRRRRRRTATESSAQS